MTATSSHFLEVRLFGAPQLSLDGQPLNDKISGKSLALLSYLIVTGRPHRRDLLADLLWTDLVNQQARNNLRYLLPALRQVVGNYLLITTQTIGFNHQIPYRLDVAVLRTTVTAKSATVSTQALQSAVDLYQGEFLAGFSVRNAPVFEEWVVQQRVAVHTLALQGFYTLAERYHQAGDFPAALATTQRLLQWEPWHEAGHRLHMHLLVAVGQRTAALTQHRLFQQTLADELGAEPEAATTALYEQIRSGAYDKMTGDKVTSTSSVTLSPPHNLPSQLTPFFGRETEIAQLCALLFDGHYHLFSLVGEGGIGKTRLALAVGQQIVNAETATPANQRRFPDGVWLVGLAGVMATESIRDQLAVVVAQASGLSFGGTQPLFTQLLAQLRTKALLLLCDNAEHLLPGLVDFLLTLLQECPRVTVLVTSRHVLNLQAEFIWRLDGLPVPSPAELTPLTATEVRQYSSVALFLERARRLQPNFSITPEDERAIAAICRLVEGLPLAIELAAALTKQYRCTELALALQEDYNVLTINLRDLAPRHRSIQTMLDHSWRFLTPLEADVLAACAIFAGGFSRAAALAVTGTTHTLLLSLVDQSLLQVHAGRFSMHGLVRQYAAAKLAPTPERRHATAARHAAYYAEQLQELAATLLVDPAARTNFQTELDNVRLAWRWCAQQGDLALFAQGVAGLESGYRLTGFYSEAIQLLAIALAAVRQALAAAPTHQPGNSLLVRLLYHLAQFYRRTGQVENGERAATEALALAQQLDDPALQGWAYHELTRLAQARSDFATMLVLAEQGVIKARLTTSHHLKAECLNDMGIAHSLYTTPLAGISHYHEARQYLQGEVNRPLEGALVSNLGFFSFAGHEYQAAYDFLQQALPLGRLLRNEEGMAITHLHLGDLWLALGRVTEAAQEYERAAPIMQAVHPPYWESWLHISIGRLHHLRGDLVAAQAACEVGRQMATTNGLQMQEQWALINLGRILADQGDYAAAHRCYEPIIAVPPQSHWAYRPADAQAALAALLLQTNDVAQAVSHVEAALAHFAQLGLAGANEPFTVYWTAVRVFSAANDPRATAVLRTAYHHLQATAEKLEDTMLRRSFLETVVVNRNLLAAAQQAGIS